MKKLLSVAVALLALAAAPTALADSGGFQAGIQNAVTEQLALGLAKSDQNAVNANVPVSIAGGAVSAGPSNATQTATSTATTDVSNKAKTDQDQHLSQNIGGSGCSAGCGGAGGFQAGAQQADTQQAAVGIAKSDQNAVNANVPVSIAGGNVSSGSSAANQKADSTANADVSNKAKTDQDQHQSQTIGGGSCAAGCGGAGGFQAGIQKADTHQGAIGVAKSDQNAVNANVPVSIAGKDVRSGSSSANQDASSNAEATVSNKAKTDQDQQLDQTIGGSGSCKAGCGGAGGFQLGIQDANTEQLAAGIATSHQNAVNANVPVSIAGGNVSSGPSDATQTATSTANADVKNKAKTDQDQHLSQDIGGSGCYAGCGGAGGFQAGIQKADTKQLALGLAKSDQNAVNGNAPVAIAGKDVSTGPSNATQTATSNANAYVTNSAKTDQYQSLRQNVGSDKGCGCDGKVRERKGDDYGRAGCHAGCGGPGGFQLGLQNAETKQIALGLAKSDQNAVNGNSPHSTAGGNIYADGPSAATQTATSDADDAVRNRARIHQNQWSPQDLG